MRASCAKFFGPAFIVLALPAAAQAAQALAPHRAVYDLKLAQPTYQPQARLRSKDPSALYG